MRTIVAVILATTVGSASAVEGAAVYKAQCAACHGAAGQGASGPAVAGKPADVVTAMVNAHFKPMNALKLSSEETAAVAAYVAGLKK